MPSQCIAYLWPCIGQSTTTTAISGRTAFRRGRLPVLACRRNRKGEKKGRREQAKGERRRARTAPMGEGGVGSLAEGGAFRSASTDQLRVRAPLAWECCPVAVCTQSYSVASAQLL